MGLLWSMQMQSMIVTTVIITRAVAYTILKTVVIVQTAIIVKRHSNVTGSTDNKIVIANMAVTTVVNYVDDTKNSNNLDIIRNTRNNKNIGTTAIVSVAIIVTRQS